MLWRAKALRTSSDISLSTVRCAIRHLASAVNLTSICSRTATRSWYALEETSFSRNWLPCSDISSSNNWTYSLELLNMASSPSILVANLSGMPQLYSDSWIRRSACANFSSDAASDPSSSAFCSHKTTLDSRQTFYHHLPKLVLQRVFDCLLNRSDIRRDWQSIGST